MTTDTVLTVEEWARVRRLGLCLAKRLAREAAQKDGTLPDGWRVAKYGPRIYRILPPVCGRPE
jgi:hypothetical protein